MIVHIQSIGFRVKKELREFIEIKTAKLIRRCTDLVKIEVTLKLVGSFSNEAKRCEIRMVIPGNDLIGTYTARTFEEAILMSIESLERKLETRKNKRIDYSLVIL